MNNDLYRRCRWCGYYKNGKCYKVNEVFDIPTIEDAHEEMLISIDMGNLKEAVTEILNCYFHTLKVARSDKDVDGIIEDIADDLERAVVNLPYQDDSNDDGIKLNDPGSDFVCIHFD